MVKSDDAEAGSEFMEQACAVRVSSRSQQRCRKRCSDAERGACRCARVKGQRVDPE